MCAPIRRLLRIGFLECFLSFSTFSVGLSIHHGAWRTRTRTGLGPRTWMESGTGGLAWSWWLLCWVCRRDMFLFILYMLLLAATRLLRRATTDATVLMSRVLGWNHCDVITLYVGVVNPE